jgi:hypothetical protein
MPADPIRPDQPDGQRRFRAFLDGLPVHEVGEQLGELPEPTTTGH